MINNIGGNVIIYSNAPTVATGYGKQTKLLLNKMHEYGINSAVSCNFGHWGSIGSYSSDHGETKLYPMDFSQDALDSFIPNIQDFSKNREDETMILTLYDVFPFNKLTALNQFEVHAWTPIDHDPVPPSSADFLKKPNVKPIAMAPDGYEQMLKRGIRSTYIPHAFDSKLFKPKLNKNEVRERLGISKNRFVFGMIPANKSNGYFHRKGLEENIRAFAIHQKSNPNSLLYIHSWASRTMGGFDIPKLLHRNGLEPKDVIIGDQYKMVNGFSDEEMADIINAMDCYLGASYGEGFQVPIIEAAACAVPSIVTNFTAPKDLVAEDSIKINGQTFWDENAESFFMIPNVNEIVEAMNQMVEVKPSGELSLEFSKNFEISKVWEDKWVPYITKHIK